MHVIVAGGHGQIALRLLRRLTADGHTATGIVRNPDHVDDVRATGAEALIRDLESTSTDQLAADLTDAGADAVVFAAGAGPGSGAARKDTVDRAASVLLADAAEQAGVRRFVQISSMGAGAPLGTPSTPGTPGTSGTDDVFATYLRAKAAAEEDLRQRPLDWTILRPGRLTNDPGRGRVQLGRPGIPGGAVSRDDVAEVLATLLVDGRAVGETLELVGGDTPISEAVVDPN